MRRIFRMTKKSPRPEEGYGWRVEKENTTVGTNVGDAATLPMNTWKANPAEKREETNPTIRIPKIIPDGPEASFIALSFNDVDAKCMAAKVLRTTRSIEVVLAGLFEYASRHPVAA